MPSLWQVCLDCVDMQSGNMLHWPITGGWSANRQLLDLMRFVWSAWRIFSTHADGKETDGQFETRMMLIEGKPELARKLTKFEEWEQARHG